jgi:archaellum biogenesis ATPase FlaH
MTYENTVEYEYLTQFYTPSQIDIYTKGQEKRLHELYLKSQPKKVPIASLMGKTEKSLIYVSSPDGWVPVVDCIEKIKNLLYKFTFEDNTTVVASHDHLYQNLDLDWHYARDIKVGDTLLSSTGASKIIDIEPIDRTTKVYDLAVNHYNHRYYTNGICSHNSGKSLFMQNIAVNWISQGLNGVFLTLELSEELTAMRLDAMVANVSTKEIFKDLDTLEMKIKMAGKKSGKLRIKYMPAQSNVNQIRSYLKELEIQTGQKTDFIMVDYLDLIMPVSAKVSPNDLFVKDKYVSEELRNLAKEFNILMVTASQLNRCLTLDTQISINGVLSPIANVKVGDELSSDQGPVTVTEVLPISLQPVYRIKTKSGKEIKCSARHLFPTKDGIRNIENGLSVGEKIYIRAVDSKTQSSDGDSPIQTP